MKESIDQFLKCNNIALVGISHKNPKFGNLAYKELKNKNYNVYPIHPKSQVIDDAQCYNTLDSIEEKIEGVLVSVQPQHSENIVVAVIWPGFLVLESHGVEMRNGYLIRLRIDHVLI